LDVVEEDNDKFRLDPRMKYGKRLAKRYRYKGNQLWNPNTGLQGHG